MQTDRKTETPQAVEPRACCKPYRDGPDPLEMPTDARRGHNWWWSLLCLVAAMVLGAIVLIRFGWQPWTAALIVILLLCPLALVWGAIQSLRRAPLVVGPAPETRGITIDWLAPVYDPMCAIMGVGVAMRRRTVSVAALKRGERVLDVGCGTGVLTRTAADAVGPEGMAVGIDPGLAMIGIARLKAARTHSRATFEPGVIERLRFGNDYFDAVLSSFMLHHLPADVKRAGLAEAWRVLKPGGRLVLVDFDTSRALARVMLSVFRLVPAYARVLRSAGDPVPLLHAVGFADAAAVGRWLGIATFWLARKPADMPAASSGGVR